MISSAIGINHPPGQSRILLVTGLQKSTMVVCFVDTRTEIVITIMRRAYHSAHVSTSTRLRLTIQVFPQRPPQCNTIVEVFEIRTYPDKIFLNEDKDRGLAT